MAEQKAPDHDDNNMTPDERLEWLRERGVIVETSEDRKRQSVANVEDDDDGVDVDTIKFVHIPQNGSKAMRELTCRVSRRKQQQSKDQLMEHLKGMFGGSSSSSSNAIDIDLLQDQANKHFSSAETPTLSADALKAVAEQGSVESFSLVHSVPSNNFTSINIYLDEIGMLKRLPINKRAGDLCFRAGFNPPPTFYGDVFIGRVKTKPVMKNMDFCLETDMSPNADWLQKAMVDNLEYQKAMNEMTGKMDVLQPSADGEDGKSKMEQNGLFSWTQNEEEVEISVTLPSSSDCSNYTSRDIKVKFLSTKFTVKCRGIDFFNLDLYARVDPDGCTWTLDKVKKDNTTKLVITCEKVDGVSWPRISK